MATYTLHECDRCKKQTRHPSEMTTLTTTAGAFCDLCNDCLQVVNMVLNNNMPTNIRLGIEAIEQLQEIAGGAEKLDDTVHLATDAVLEALVTLEDYAAK